MSASAIGLVLVSLGVLFLPGGAVAAAGGLRAPIAIATAPLITYGLATASGTVAGVVDFRWSPWLLAGEAAVLAGLLWLCRSGWAGNGRGRWAGEREGRRALGRRRPRVRDLVVGGGILVGGLIAMLVLAAGFGGLDRPNQRWDYTFHANAVRVIADSGDVAPSALRIINNWEADSFYYPNAYHALAALVRDLTGAPVFEVLNSQTLLVAGLGGLGLAVLLRDMGAPTAVTATTPVLLAGFASFPYDILWHGPLLPYATGLALTPAFLLLVREVVHRPGPSSAVLAGLGGAALIGLHPSVALSGVVLAGLFLLQRWVSRRRVGVREVVLLAGAGVLSVVLAAPAVLGSLRTGTGVATVINWRAVETPGQAVGQLLLLNHEARTPQLALAALMLVGLLSIRSARYMGWWLTGAGLAGFLFVLAASSDSGFAEVVTRPWWNDRWRFAALAVLGMAPLAAHGLWRISLAVSSWAGRLPAPPLARRPSLRPAASAMIVLGLVVLASSGLYAGRNSQRVASAHQSDLYLNSAEVTAMAWLAPRVRSGETVMNDPADGSAYLLALEGVRPLFGHQVPESAAATIGPTRSALLARFRCLDSDVDIRDAVDDLNIRYVFVGVGFVPDGIQRTPGLERLVASPSLDLVYAVDGVRIYEIDLQPRADQPLPGCGHSATGSAPG